MTHRSPGIKNPINIGARIYTRIPKKVSKLNETTALTFAIFSARAIFFAPIFCPTRTDVAIERPIAGIMISWRILDPAP